ncbi:MAG: ribonuclease III [Planctomycetota bacterium]
MKALPHRFRDADLLELALTHASTEGKQDNERLEFLGDAVLDLIVAERLFADDPRATEGELTERKSAVVSRRSLAEAARALNLEDLARVGRGMRRGVFPRSVLANLYEAVLGAVYLDGGLDAAERFVDATLSATLASVADRRAGEEPKQRLQHLAQCLTGDPPTYVQLEERGVAHARAFQIAAEVGKQRYPAAWGRTRKEAERWAAYEALLVLDDGTVA